MDECSEAPSRTEEAIPPPSGEKRETSSPRPLLEHPLTVVLVSFVLTVVLGAWLTSSIQKRQAEIEREVRHYETSTSAIVAFSNSIYRRYVRAGLLKSALSRRAPLQEIKHRKELYDEPLVEQESSMLGYHLLIREALREQDYDDFEKYYEFALKPRFDMLDRTLTALADEYGKTQAVNGPLPSRLACASELYTEVVVCNSAIANAVFRSISSKRYLSGRQVIDTQQKAKTDMDAQCPLWEKVRAPAVCEGQSAHVR